MIIAFEGPDCSGKSTLARELFARVPKRFQLAPDRIRLYQFPTATGFGAVARAGMQATLPEGMRMFHFASLQALMVVDAYTYAGALSAASGPRSQQWAVTDRWFVSGLVYTRANKLIERLTPELQAAYDRLPRPDLTVFCTVPDAVLDERLRARDKDVYEADPDMQTRVRAAYNDQIARAPLAKLVVDTTLPVERCLDTIFQRLVRMI